MRFTDSQSGSKQRSRDTDDYEPDRSSLSDAETSIQLNARGESYVGNDDALASLIDRVIFAWITHNSIKPERNL